MHPSLRSIGICSVLALALALAGAPAPAVAAEAPAFSLVIHGGAGTIRRAEMSAEREAEYRAALEEALTIGYRVLEEGGESLDAVEAVIRFMEDSPLFNAGKGAVFTADGRNELDASIMDGPTRMAGAVAGVTTIKHPITAARAVMERTPHVLLAGPGAELFAAEQGLELVPPSYFHTERRWQQLLEKRRQEAAESGAEEEPEGAFGTVGAVALDRQGRIAAGTSTGGLTYKRHGRVGDSPIVGAGTFADSECGVSGTGQGEFFIRFSIAYDICARRAYLGIDLQEAAEQVVLGVVKQAGGDAGVIALDRRGAPVQVFNTDGMYRGFVAAGGEPRIAIYGDDRPTDQP